MGFFPPQKDAKPTLARRLNEQLTCILVLTQSRGSAVHHMPRPPHPPETKAWDRVGFFGSADGTGSESDARADNAEKLKTRGKEAKGERTFANVDFSNFVRTKPSHGARHITHHRCASTRVERLNSS